MNREIKFRAWDIESKKYRTQIPVIEEWWDSDCWDDSEQALEDPYISLDVGRQFSHRLIWEQYTGLKDKNGKEIYEGDILDLSSQPEKICWYEVQWGTRPEYVGYVMQPIKKETKSYMHIPRDWDSRLDVISKWKIIGNIHENPELLKK